jgi:hypothetical protein
MAFHLEVDHGRWWLVLGGVALIIYGLLLLIAPLVGALVLTWWFGAYALVFGVALVVLAFRLKARHDEPSARGAGEERAMDNVHLFLIDVWLVFLGLFRGKVTGSRYDE